MSRRKTRALRLEKHAQYFVLFVLASIPLLFGAAHPFVQGIYTALLLVGCGGWLLLNFPALGLAQPGLVWLVPPLLIILYAVLLSLPLPLSLVAVLSPHRAGTIARVNELAGTDYHWISLGFSQQVALKEGIYYLSILVYFLCLEILLPRDRRFYDRLLRVMIVVGVIEALYGLLQVVSPSLGVLWLKNAYKSACGTIIYKNQFAAFLNLCWPVALAVGLGFYSRRLAEMARRMRKYKHHKRKFLKKKLAAKNDQAPLYWFATALIMLAVLFSLSRAGVLSMLFIWLLIFALLSFSRKSKIFLFASILLLILVFGSILGFDTIVRRFALLDVTGMARIRLWLASLAIARDFPWTGTGLESYRVLSPVYLEHFPDTVLYDRAHNEYIELVIELGLPVATGLFLWIMALMIRSVRRLWKIRRLPFHMIRRSTLVGITSLAAITGFLLHGAVDFAWRLPANLLYCTTLAAFVSYALRVPEPAPGTGTDR
ncbi:MAG TPA: O-antigen ligase domain-containing protein [Desulfobulbus sp.]|nr:O-antigen ligase domain-containing protein [Desulfobulbus sp.]